MRWRSTAATLALLLLTATPAWAEELRGRVVAIYDGDTLTILTADRRQVRVRLAEIDTPDSRQPYGNRARQALAAMFVRQNVRVVVVNTDRYGHKVGRVYVGPLDVNWELVQQGAAWVSRHYLHDRMLLAVEAEARMSRRALVTARAGSGAALGMAPAAAVTFIRDCVPLTVLSPCADRPRPASKRFINTTNTVVLS